MRGPGHERPPSCDRAHCMCASALIERFRHFVFQLGKNADANAAAYAAANAADVVAYVDDVADVAYVAGVFFLKNSGIIIFGKIHSIP